MNRLTALLILGGLMLSNAADVTATPEFPTKDGRTPRKLKLPLTLTAQEPIDATQRRGHPVQIRAVRTIGVMASQHHRSTNNIVAFYIGLPTVDAGQDNVILEKVTSHSADPSAILPSEAGDSLMVEYWDVKPGFTDEISMTFTVDLYERQADMSSSKPYDLKSNIYTSYADTDYNPLKREKPTDPGSPPRPILRDAGIHLDERPTVKARKVYNFLAANLRYGGTSSLTGNGNINCATYANLFVKLCQRAHVPTRRCAGFALGVDTDNANGTTASGHNWAECYFEGVGWVPVDPTMGDKKDFRREYFFGSLDNGRLCVSKTGLHEHLPLWYRESAKTGLLFTENAGDFKGFSGPQTIQGVHRFNYAYDSLDVDVVPLDVYGPSLTVLSRSGTFSKPPTQQTGSELSSRQFADCTQKATTDISLDLGGGVQLELALIPAGTFMMGSPTNDIDRRGDEEPKHEVTITKPFYMGKFEVTQAEYERVMGSNPSNFKGPHNPVERILWDDAQTFCRKASELTRKTVRLPTEAEWEYACRAGTTTRFNGGDQNTDLALLGWYHENSADGTYAVGGKAANAWGLYDMHGNVWEWCADWYGNNYYAGSPEADPTGPATGRQHVLRGGSWHFAPKFCRSSSRVFVNPDAYINGFGFRVVVNVTETPSRAP